MAQAQQTDQDTTGRDLATAQLLSYFACRSDAGILTVAPAASAERPRALSLAESALFLPPQPNSDHANFIALAVNDSGGVAGSVVRGGCDLSAWAVSPDR
jgi:hypothetical protein